MIHVTLDFEIDAKPVTAGEMRRAGYSQVTGADDDPAKNVTWYEATSYAQFIGKRLPTEQEWLAALADAEFVWSGLWEWTATPEKNRYILLGGSWNLDPYFLRAAYRYYFHPDYRFVLIGFRCAR